MQIRLITYNIHRAIGVDRRFRPERIVEILRHHDGDLVLLQEVDDGAPRSQEMDLARELAREAGYPHFAVGHNVTLRKGRYGNATLSRYPIVRERNIDLTIGLRKRRGCQHTTLDLGDGVPPLEVFNLHLGLSARERHRQIDVLFESKELQGALDGSPALVAGDFNDWRSLLRETFTNGQGFRCATDGRTGGDALATYPSFSPQGGLDRIYYRGPLQPTAVRRCRLQIARVASDHLPVVADFHVG